ncbi:MAG: tRNA 2-selenouridine(34) synthase MnmH [Gallionellales bacterium RIFCSPLOWO2_02_FULL_57_47]|nr:MAG: tRNA 2-selenouridine(34) synthase MnmH [Gallionellales bacterium RIFCSPLOWO2_02_FULL_57_47]OGT07743.1 MAG: tRNA 2-selenouridine(34) synthase MnmH [Gallionellales bacterium RIFCSPHIGHO2_02_FULL_57_16]
MLFKTANLSQLGEFDEIIDVRTPAEFAEDHIPGAINCPVLSDEERITVGTLYKQVSPFEARKAGAALVAKNIAHHLQTRFHDRPKSWRPLIYCWRGGQRSGAMSIILSQVGWAAHKLEGGYKTYRRDVLEKLEALPQSFTFRVICGPTGSGKSRLLNALAESGQQVLDLEMLAKHRGSVLGKLPEQAQPSQKWFDSALLQAMQSLDPARPVFVEAESNKIGQITLPPALITAMHASVCLVLETPQSIRVAGLLEDYLHYLENPEILIAHLQSLHRFHGTKQLEHWSSLIHAGDFATMVAELLTMHYDPSYFRATSQHFAQLGTARHILLEDLSHDALKKIAAEL